MSARADGEVRERVAENSSTKQPVTLLLPKVITAMREARGLSMYRVAQRGNLCEDTLSRVEAGTHVPTSETLERIACGMNVRQSQILLEAERQAGLWAGEVPRLSLNDPAGPGSVVKPESCRVTSRR